MDDWRLDSFAWLAIAGPFALAIVLAYKAVTDEWGYALLALWAGSWAVSALVVLRDFGNAHPWVGSILLRWVLKLDLLGTPLIIILGFVVAIISSGSSGGSGSSGRGYGSGAPESRTAGARLSVGR